MSEVTASTKQASRPPLRGWRLLLIRIVWSAPAILVITVFIASALTHFRYEIQQSVTQEAVVGQDTSPPAHFRVGYAIAFDSLTALVFAFTAASTFWRGPGVPLAAGAAGGKIQVDEPGDGGGAGVEAARAGFA